MDHDTRVRILMPVIAMGMATLIAGPEVQSGSLPGWAFGVILAFAAAGGLLSPEIERAWARSGLWGSDSYWRNRRG